MDILLDTQAIIWYVENETLLTQKAREAIRQADLVYVSPFSFYEIAVKLAIAKNVGVKRTLPEMIQTVLKSGFAWLPVSAKHIEAYLSIPFFANHKDPFDRILLATALADNLKIVSSDHNFPLYNAVVKTIW